jgi:hypothetical protein
LAGAGFILALTSLAWQFWYAVRIDRPRLRVKTKDMQIVGQGTPPFDVIAMTVTNVGRRATVLQTVHPTLGRHTFCDRVWPAGARPKPLRGTKRILPFASGELAQLNDAALLPKRLEPGDEVTVYVRTTHVRQALHEAHMTRVHALASASTAGSRASRSIRLDLDKP